MLSFILYVIGSIVGIAGLAWIATALGASQVIVNATAGIVFALSILGAAVQRRVLEPPAS